MHRGVWGLPAVLAAVHFCGWGLCAPPAACSDRSPSGATGDAIAGGLLQLPPEHLTGKNQVSNSTFEEGDSGRMLPPCWSVDATTVHQGQHSLRFTADQGCRPLPALSRVSRGPNAGRSYTLRAWVRITEGSNLRVRVSLHDTKDRGFVLGETDFASPGATWQQIVREHIDLLPVHDGHPLEVRAEVQGTGGSAWFDDVELVEEDPPALSAFLLYPNFHGFLWSNGPQEIRVQIDVGLREPPTALIRASIKGEGGGTVKCLERVARASQELDFDGSSFTLGIYQLEVELVDRRSGKRLAGYPAYRITKVSGQYQAGLMNYISPDNFLVHLGKKRFVWGAYDRFSARFRCRQCLYSDENGYLEIPGLAGKTTLENYADSQINAEMNILPFAGVQVVPPRDQLTPWLEVLNREGVGHLQIVNNWIEGSRSRPLWATGWSDMELWTRLASTMKGKPGGIGYYTYDEPRPDQIPAVFEQYKVLREQDPGSVDYGVLLSPSQIFRWRDASDVLGCDPYPVNSLLNADAVAYGATSPPAMLLTSAWARAAVRQVHASRPIWMVLQLFHMAGFFPTYEQMKMQAYKAIINGATGILWWGFVSERGLEAEWFEENDHQSYLDFRRISKEVMALEPALTAAPQPELLASVSDPHIESLVKVQGNRIVIFASNFLPEPTGDVTFTLVPGALTSGSSLGVEVYSENRRVPLNKTKSSAMFSDSFAPYEVHVYILNTEVASAHLGRLNEKNSAHE